MQQQETQPDLAPSTEGATITMHSAGEAISMPADEFARMLAAQSTPVPDVASKE